MENIASFLKTTISILITLAIISAGLFLWSKTQPIVELANSQAAAQARELSDQQYSAFDNQIVSGSQILTAYRRYEAQQSFYIYVRTIRSGVTTDFSMNPNDSDGTSPNFDYAAGTLKTGTAAVHVTETDITNASSTFYVPPQSRYRATLIRDANARVSAIFFSAQ